MRPTKGGRRTLVLNAGSSSLKVSLVDPDDTIVQAETIEDWDGDYAGLDLPDWDHDVIGHRVVHGGSRFTGPAWIDDRVRADLAELAPFAPLHQPRSCAGIDAAARAYPDSPAFAAFDTSFHAGLPAVSRIYAVPQEWPVRRYGAHGLSHAYTARRAAELLDRDPRGLRVVTCHLGSGASLCSVDGGRSIDTTMGLTPLEGLVMSSRSGTVDPGMILWLQRHHGMGAAEVQEALEQESGLLALAGTGDMETVVRAAEAADEQATFALDVYVHRLAKEAVGMMAATRGTDAIVFTGGVGEHSPLVRSRVARALSWVGVHIDEDRNDRCRGDGVLSAHPGDVGALVVSTHEDVEVARHGRALEGTSREGGGAAR
ncbi:acetate/propionate family kinase [Janibacter corallicola]|uniref:acetate/propionate family kinase n=1 Tax=Janibacter corallicola TaxID=415212 RepID=UPI000A4EA9A4|nr:acetate/propionate family kinase [Janibacter corallicola]